MVPNQLNHSSVAKALVGLIALSALGYFFGAPLLDIARHHSAGPRHELSPQSPAEARAAESLEDYIKKYMHDPGSYEHISTRFEWQDGKLTVYTAFRGKNAFGNTVVNEARAKATSYGDLVFVDTEQTF